MFNLFSEEVEMIYVPGEKRSVEITVPMPEIIILPIRSETSHVVSWSAPLKTMFSPEEAGLGNATKSEGVCAVIPSVFEVS